MDNTEFDDRYRRIKNVRFGVNVSVMPFVNLYGCDVGDNSFIGPFVEIQHGVKIGTNVRIESHTFICTGVTIEDNVFIGHGVTFVNDLYPPRYNEDFWEKTIVCEHSSIGNNATILPVKIGKYVIIGAGSTVTKDVEDSTIVAGNPAKVLRRREGKGIVNRGH